MQGLLRAAGLVFLLACGSTSERVIVSTKTAVSADIVRVTGERWTDRGKVRIDALEVVVHSSPKASVGTVCSPTEDTNPALSLDREAERVAYRCAPGKGWHVFDLRKKRADAFRRCTTVAGDTLDWARVPAFEASRVSLMGCALTDAAAGMMQSFSSIVEESRARGGAKGVVDFLAETLAIRAEGSIIDAKGTDDWDRTFASLSAAERAGLAPRFRAALESGSELTAVRRALLHADLGDPTLVDALERAGKKLAAEPSATGDIDAFREKKSALEVIVRTLSSKRLGAAADIACESSSRTAANGQSRMLPREQLAAIALAKKTCSLDGVFERSVCSPSYGCCAKGFVCADASRRPCKAADLDALLKLEVSRSTTDPWPANANGGSADELLVAAAMVQSASPAAQRFLERIKKVPDCSP